MAQMSLDFTVELVEFSSKIAALNSTGKIFMAEFVNFD